MAEASVGPGPSEHADEFDLGVDAGGHDASVDDFDFDFADNQKDQLVQQPKSPFEDPVGESAETNDEALVGGDGLDISAAGILEDDAILGGAEFDIDEIDYNLGGENIELDDDEQHSIERKQEMTLEILEEGGGEDAVGANDAPQDDLDEITYEEQPEPAEAPLNDPDYNDEIQKETEVDNGSDVQHESEHDNDEPTEDAADYQMDATATPRSYHSSHDNDFEADDENSESKQAAQSHLNLGLDKAGFSYETDQEDAGAKIPDVIIVYANTEYPLFGNPETDDPDHYFFEDLEILRYPLSRFLQSIRGVLTEWVGSDEEVRVLVHGLDLEFGETTTDALLEQVTFHQLLSLHSTLCRNDEPDSSTRLRCTIRTMSHCALRIKKLVECASQGKGYGWLESEDAVNQSSGEGTEVDAVSQDVSQHGETDDDEVEDSSEDAASSNEHDPSGMNVDDEDGTGNGEASHSVEDEDEDDDEGSDQYDHDNTTAAEVLSQADAEEIITNLSPAISAQPNAAFGAVTGDEQIAENEGAMDGMNGLDTMLPPPQEEDGAATGAQDLNDPAYPYLDLDATGAVMALNEGDAPEQPLDDDDYLDLGGADHEVDELGIQETRNLEDDAHDAAEAGTSATATLDGDEIDYEDHSVAAKNVVEGAPEALASSVLDPLQSQQAETDEIDWDDGEKLASFDNGIPSPQSIIGKRGREMDEADGLAEEHDVKRHRS